MFRTNRLQLKSALVACITAATMFGGGMIARADVPKILSARQDADKVIFSFTVPPGFDHVHYRWTGPGHGEQQEEHRLGSKDSQGRYTYTIPGAVPQAAYTFKVQGVRKHAIGRDDCTPWAESTFRTSTTSNLYGVFGLVNHTSKPLKYSYQVGNGPETPETIRPNDRKIFWHTYSHPNENHSPDLVVIHSGALPPSLLIDSDPHRTKVKRYSAPVHDWDHAKQYEFYETNPKSYGIREIN
jgi:hypothetical protein